MHLRSLLITSIAALTYAIPVTAASFQQGPASSESGEPLPPPLTSALKRFSEMAANGELPARRRMPAPSPSVCSIPLVEVPHQLGSRMPRVPAYSLDRNQVPPPAPPCTADNRIRPKQPAPRFYGPRIRPLELKPMRPRIPDR